MKKLRLILSPYFLSKYYILRDVKIILKKYSFTGTVLDVGCGEKPYKKYFTKVKNYDGIDFKNYSRNKDFIAHKPDLFFPKSYLESFELPFQDNYYNAVVTFQVLEHHKKPMKLISEINRIVKPGGYVLLTVPFLGGVHERPHDYQRYTEYGLKELFSTNNLNILEIMTQGSVFSTISLLLNEALNSFASKGKIYYLFSVILYVPLFIFQHICIPLDKIVKSDNVVFNYLILAEKPRNVQ